MKLIEIKNRYKYARINAGFTQVDVVKHLGFLTKGGLKNIEKEQSLPSNKIMYALPKLYNVSLDYLVKEDNYMNHDDFIKETIQLDQESINILKNLIIHNQPLTDLENYLNKLKEDYKDVNY